MTDSRIAIETTTVKSRFNLPAFSFLLCFVLLMSNWWGDVHGATSFFVTAFCAGALSLVGWVLIAILLRIAVLLPLSMATHLDHVASWCYLACFGVLLHFWWSPAADPLEMLWTMALSAVLAIPCSLVLIFPARVLSRFLGDLFGNRKSALVEQQSVEQPNTIALICKEMKGRQEFQLWVRGSKHGFYWEVRAVDCLGGKRIRPCVLETGSFEASRKKVVEDGKAAYERWKA